MPSTKEVINTSSGSEWSRVPVQIKYTNSRDIDLGSILDHQKEATRTICREVHGVKEEVMESRDSILSNMATEFQKIKDLSYNSPTISVTQDDLVKALHVSWQGTKLLENVNREELTVVNIHSSFDSLFSVMQIERDTANDHVRQLEKEKQQQKDDYEKLEGAHNLVSLCHSAHNNTNLDKIERLTEQRDALRESGNNAANNTLNLAARAAKLEDQLASKDSINARLVADLNSILQKMAQFNVETNGAFNDMIESIRAETEGNGDAESSSSSTDTDTDDDDDDDDDGECQQNAREADEVFGPAVPR